MIVDEGYNVILCEKLPTTGVHIVNDKELIEEAREGSYQVMKNQIGL
jgi:hypothetical protein